MCYFSSPKDEDAKGWIYLRDVTEIFDDDKSFSVISPSRSMTLVPPSRNDHRLWVESLVELCPNARIDGIKCKLYPIIL